jgi:hypothetical protein
MRILLLEVRADLASRFLHNEREFFTIESNFLYDLLLHWTHPQILT